MRRIEALTGRGAEAYVRELRERIQVLDEIFSARPGEECQRAQELVAQLREQRRTIQDLQRSLSALMAEQLIAQAVEVQGTKVLATQTPAADAAEAAGGPQWPLPAGRTLRAFRRPLGISSYRCGTPWPKQGAFFTNL